MRTAFSFAEVAEMTGGKQLKIGEVSRRAGVGIETLRFYEKSGLIDRPGRTESGYRLYDESVLERLSFVKKAQMLGFTLDEIKQLIDHKSAGLNPCAEVRQIVTIRLEQLNERIEQMVRYRAELRAALGEWGETGEADGHVCGLIEKLNIEHGMEHRKVGKY